MNAKEYEQIKVAIECMRIINVNDVYYISQDNVIALIQRFRDDYLTIKENSETTKSHEQLD